MFQEIDKEGSTDVVVVSKDKVTGINCYIRLKLFDGEAYQSICVYVDKSAYALSEVLEPGMLISGLFKKRIIEDRDYFDLIDFEIKKYEPYQESDVKGFAKEINKILTERLEDKYLNVCLSVLKALNQFDTSITRIADGFLEYSYPGGLAVHIFDLLKSSDEKFHTILSVLAHVGAYKYFDSSYDYGIVTKSDMGQFFSKKYFTNELISPIIQESELNDTEKMMLLHAVNYCNMPQYCKLPEAVAFYHYDMAVRQKRKLEVLQKRCLGDMSMGKYLKSFEQLEETAE